MRARRREGIDTYGRNVGFSLDGQRKQAVAYDPATGRIANMDGFAWQYLPGTDLKQTLTYPNGTVAEWVYEPRRDLLTLVSNDVFSAYAYENDAVGRRIAKNTERYGYNVRGELIAATNGVAATSYAYTFDDIGNRVVAEELGTNIAYSANALNQYTNIVAEAVFVPEFDDDGNQLLVKTSTGIWQVTYNAENRPVVWSNETAVITMDFDRMGRRVWYKSVSGIQTNAFSKFVYDGYLCVQRLDGFTGNVEQEYVWDPTETVATRPLKWSLPARNRTFHYFHDGNKNVSDVIDADSATLAAHYDYAPFGAVTAATGSFADANPFRFSSEYHDDALGCVYYNYRHYNPLDGRWMSRDPIGEVDSHNCFALKKNQTSNQIDYLGLFCWDYGPRELLDFIIKPVGTGSKIKFLLEGWELITTEAYPILTPIGSGLILRQHCRCKCRAEISTYAYSIKCEKWGQPKRCEYPGPCGTLYSSPIEDLGWTGGVEERFLETKTGGSIIVSAPAWTDGNGDSQCFISCAFACGNHNPPEPYVGGFTTCAALAKSEGK